MTTSGLSFACLLIKEEKGYTALCADLDVASDAATPAKAKKMLQEAVELYLDSALESNLPYIRPVPRDEDPRATRPNDVVETFTIRADLSIQVHA